MVPTGKDEWIKVNKQCNHMTFMLIIMVVIWFLSCFTSFAINQNDFQREFGDLIPKIDQGEKEVINGSQESKESPTATHQKD